MSPRPAARRLARPALLVVATIALLGACSPNGGAPDSYGDTSRDNFQEGCVAGLTDDGDDVEGEALSEAEAEEACTCSYEGIVEEIPFEDFKEIDAEQSEEPGPLDPRIQEIVDRCKGELG